MHHKVTRSTDYRKLHPRRQRNPRTRTRHPSTTTTINTTTKMDTRPRNVHARSLLSFFRHGESSGRLSPPASPLSCSHRGLRQDDRGLVVGVGGSVWNPVELNVEVIFGLDAETLPEPFQLFLGGRERGEARKSMIPSFVCRERGRKLN